MILGYKFHILGIKTTLGQHIAKNLPVYMVNGSLRNKLQWNINLNSYIFIHENARENVVYEMVSIFVSASMC